MSIEEAILITQNEIYIVMEYIPNTLEKAIYPKEFSAERLTFDDMFNITM